MRKLLALVGADRRALAIPAAALAVDSARRRMSGLGLFSEGGTFHFVATASDVGDSTLTVDFSGVGDCHRPGHRRSTTRARPLDDRRERDDRQRIEATVGDKLVLSDFDCDEKKGDEP